MSAKERLRKIAPTFLAIALPLLVMGLLIARLEASSTPLPIFGARETLQIVEELSDIPEATSPSAPTAACAGGPTIDGVLLDECYVENFTVGGDSKSITVWYTNNVVTATRTVDGSPVSLTHWVNTDAQAQQVATFGRQAWQAYHTIYGRHPYNCSNNINVQLEDGVGWSGIAYWASSGSCWIGIDSPMVRGGVTQNIQWVVYHEFQHYQQYAFNSGCYGYLKPNYPADSEYVEGYADLAADAVDATLDATGYNNAVGAYNPTTSFFDKSYFDVFNKYFIEQVGSLWTAADPKHHMDAVRDHYAECDAQDTLYVLDTLIPTLKPGLTEEKLFLNFFGANWAKDWANATTQPELVYLDDDGNPYGQIALAFDVNLASGSQSWAGQTTPDDWAGRYYQVRPQGTCRYVTADVNGAPGAHLGINLMAADTTAPTSVSRTAWIGENLTRTFAGAGVHDLIVAAVNAFASNANYDVSFTCVTPVLDILEPKQTNFALVGSPDSPISFLARFKVTSGGTPVRGLPAASFTADAEGGAVTIVPGSFQEVGEEYWAIMVPPVKPAGTTFVDLRICLDTTICDTETDALLYVAPGNTDFALTFDASGSMNTEDVPGEGKRVDNAKKAGTVLADLLRTGDRIAVTDFSAFNNPVGCGLPGGDGNCPLDIRTRLARTDVVGPATITAAKNAINNISAREWTPIGAGLRDAKNKLQAAPYSLNPKHIVLLSDGEENVNPLYATVRDELVASGVVIDTIAFSGEAAEALMAQIAADTGGSYRFVPTTPGSMAAAGAPQAHELERLGVPGDVAEILSTSAAFLPGPLALDDVYDYFETKGQEATRLFHFNRVSSADSTYGEKSTFVDPSVTTLRLVVAGKQYDADVTNTCEGYHRDVDVLPPGADPRQGWIPISPPTTTPPPGWDIRNSTYDDVVIISNPAEGVWKVRARYRYLVCVGGKVDEQASLEAASQLTSDFIINGSVETDVRLKGRFLAPIVNNKGQPGDRVPIVATLLTRTGARSGADVTATIEKPGDTDYLVLRDDGLHADGAPNDGIYGGYYSQTNIGGTYNVRIIAAWTDKPTGNRVYREWLGSFWIQSVSANDRDKDGMPDPWEKRCGLDTNRNDAAEDKDHDGLSNIQEFRYGTLPCDPDTDGGGERDGSEIECKRDPLNPADDQVQPLGRINVRELNQRAVIHWVRPMSYTNMILYISTDPNVLGQARDIGTTGTYTLTNLVNDQNYYLTLAGKNGCGEGDYSKRIRITPKSDPDPPSGAILINNGAERTFSKNVILNLSATDEPLKGMAQSANAHLGGELALEYNTVSGGVQMRISNSPSMAGAVWEPFAAEKPWTLADAPSRTRRVYAQFRDAAGNVSYIVSDDIIMETGLYVSPVRSGVPVSGTVTVELRIDNIEHLYGVQVEMSFDPNLLDVVDAYNFVPGVQIQEGDFLIPDVTFSNQVNNTTGTINYTVSLRGEKPGVDGSGVLARIVFHGKNEGVSQVKFTQSILSDPQSLPIHHVTQGGQVTVRKSTGAVTGKVILERRIIGGNAGTQVCLDANCVVTAADGEYSFDNVTPGNHTVTASRMSYLQSWRTANVPVGLLNLPDVTLLGGDVNQDKKIELADATLVGQAWNSTPASANWDQRADITNDSRVNVLDMVAVQFNWDEVAPGPWPGAVTEKRPEPAGVSEEAREATQPEGLQAAQVVITPTLASLVSVSQTVRLDILVNNVTNLYSARIKLTFDPRVIQVQDSDPRVSAPGVQIIPGDFLDPINQQVLINAVDNTAGTIDFAVTQTFPAAPQSGSGRLAAVVFEAVGTGISPVHMDTLRLLDNTLPNPLDIPASVQDGRVVVGSAYRIALPLIMRGGSQ